MAKKIVMIVVGMFIFIGLPLLGWGLDNVKSFFNDPARVLYVMVIILLQLFAAVYLSEGGKPDGHTRLDGRPKVDLILIQILSILIVVAAPHTDRYSLIQVPGADVLRYAGLAFVVAGFIVMQLSRKQLGRQFSVEVTIQKEHELVKDGLYRYIRHPRYLGITVFFTGISLVFRSYVAMALTAALAVVLIWRINAEETLLRHKFGRKWEEYRSRSWRLIPFLF